jgi:hypothetical protein
VCGLNDEQEDWREASASPFLWNRVPKSSLEMADGGLAFVSQIAG